MHATGDSQDKKVETSHAMQRIKSLYRDLLEGEQHIQGLLDNGSEHLKKLSRDAEEAALYFIGMKNFCFIVWAPLIVAGVGSIACFYIENDEELREWITSMLLPNIFCIEDDIVDNFD